LPLGARGFWGPRFGAAVKRRFVWGFGATFRAVRCFPAAPALRPGMVGRHLPAFSGEQPSGLLVAQFVSFGLPNCWLGFGRGKTGRGGKGLLSPPTAPESRFRFFSSQKPHFFCRFFGLVRAAGFGRRLATDANFRGPIFKGGLRFFVRNQIFRIGPFRFFQGLVEGSFRGGGTHRGVSVATVGGRFGAGQGARKANLSFHAGAWGPCPPGFWPGGPLFRGPSPFPPLGARPRQVGKRRYSGPGRRGS